MEQKEKMESSWSNGQVTDSAPQWAKYRQIMTGDFPSPFRGSDDPLAQAIMKAIQKIDNLRPEKGGPAYLGSSSKLTYEYPDVKAASIKPESQDLDSVMEDTINLFQGMPNVASPLTMANVWPQPNTASIIASIFPLIFMPNIIEGEYSWNVHKAELESAGMIANLFGWEPTKAGCIYTYGGSGCWLYGLKYALTRVLPDSRNKGIRTDAKVLCSAQSHYCRENETDWTGLGMDNIVLIPTDDTTNQMSLEALEERLKEFQSQGIPVASIICTMGTTDASVFDPIAEVRQLMDKYPNPQGYGQTLLYADAVAGWSWIMFDQYDFESNPLEFSQEVLAIAKKNMEIIKGIHYADAIGVDFHKFGWSPYVSSCFVYKDAAEFENILRRGSYAYLQEVTPYNPMYYTLEVSRSAAGSLAGWATMKYLGVKGFQSILGGILEVRYYLQTLIDEHPQMVMADADDDGFITLFRVYPEGVDADSQFNKELTDKNYRGDLIKYNQFTEAIGEKLFNWYLSGKQVNGKYTPHMAYSTGFRNADYNPDGTDPEAVIYALKCYPMNVFVTPEVMKHALNCVIAARDEVLQEMK
ncbi:pyridoxal phosphate-dependent decarboxylase family protein [Parabacteroides pacaensis]|uniref:pyridoxal phosphate-dependent decarboxylase family protein n=1 Tax=Parabacteroides pacaensis TaxID=2086575 RepID=UPI0018FF0432|nr:pyridoxal-dependent decarboxylase [Parabacteroides pacaensis]